MRLLDKPEPRNPSTETGIAAHFPGDMGIEADPRVYFAENFEQGVLNDVSKRWETVTSTDNMSFSDDVPARNWGKLIGDVPAATAILDHFLYHADILSIKGKSYWLRNWAATEDAATTHDSAAEGSVVEPDSAETILAAAVQPPVTESNAAIPPTGPAGEKPSRRSAGKRSKNATTACQT